MRIQLVAESPYPTRKYHKGLSGYKLKVTVVNEEGWKPVLDQFLNRKLVPQLAIKIRQLAQR